MGTFQRSSGVELQLPDALGVDVVSIVPSSSLGRRKMPPGAVSMPAATPSGIGTHSGDLADALRDQDMELVDTFEIYPQASAPPTRGVKKSDREARIALDLSDDEDAVLLLEQDGVYSWHNAKSNQTVRSGATRSGPLVVPPTKRVTFVIDLQPPSAPADQRKRGPIADFLVGKVRAFVFKFAAQWVVDTAVKILERNVNRGLVHINSDDAAKWMRIADLSAVALPSERSARVLLLVHGTFSTTIGSYGALTVTDQGKAFIKSALAWYDLILGFDHPTLSEDPLANATELLASLETARWKTPPLIDAIAYSRGALVLRSLIEYLLPVARNGMRVRRAIFVGGTNGGTLLAQPENWEIFVDLYTNLAVAGCKVLQLFPAATAAATAIKECIASIGALVKYIAVAALRDRVAPGLAAMTPSGDFIATINKQQPGQPTAFDSYYCVVTSEFDAKLALSGTDLPVALVHWLLDSAADRLIGESNDLVVNIDSMSHFESGGGSFIKDRLDFGPNPNVFHTVYFAQPKVAEALTRWLELDGLAAESDTHLPLTDSNRSERRLATPIRNILLASADAPFASVIKAVRTRLPSYVVVERKDNTQKYHYALAADEVIGREKPAQALPGAKISLRDALAGSPFELHEYSASKSVQLGEVPSPAEGAAQSPARARTIVFEGEEPHAVIPTSLELTGVSLSELSKRAGTAAVTPRRTKAGTHGGGHSGKAVRRAIPRADTRAPRKEAGSADAAQREHYYFGASMPEAVVVKKIASATVTISRDAIEAAVGEIQATGEGVVVGNHKLIVQVIAKANLEVVGDDRYEMEPLSIERKTELVFDIRGTDIGRGELWVIIRQGPTKLSTLILKPEVTSSVGHSVQSIRAAAESASADALREALPVLQIFERQNGSLVSYVFVLDMGNSNYIKAESRPFKTDRATYVAGIYKEIETRWVRSKLDIAAFNGELRDYGADLFDELVPQAIQEALWPVRDNLRAIHVLSEEPFIPWELVHLKPPAQGGLPQTLPDKMHFLGQKGLVRWLHNYRNAPLSIEVHNSKAFYAIPKYPHPDYELPEAQEEIPFLRDTIKATAVKAVEANAIRTLLSTPGQVDLFHFSGHGEADPGSGMAARILLTGRVDDATYLPDYLRSSAVANSARLIGPDGNRAIAVLNACQIGRIGWQLTSVGGFAEAFLRAGAGIFLGTLWSVGDAPARAFTEAFYKTLLSGNSLAEASIAGREAAKAAGDGTWLAYVIYGHPYAKVKFE